MSSSSSANGKVIKITNGPKQAVKKTALKETVEKRVGAHHMFSHATYTTDDAIKGLKTREWPAQMAELFKTEGQHYTLLYYATVYRTMFGDVSTRDGFSSPVPSVDVVGTVTPFEQAAWRNIVMDRFTREFGALACAMTGKFGESENCPDVLGGVRGNYIVLLVANAPNTVIDEAAQIRWFANTLNEKMRATTRKGWAVQDFGNMTYTTKNGATRYIFELGVKCFAGPTQSVLQVPGILDGVNNARIDSLVMNFSTFRAPVPPAANPAVARQNWQCGNFLGDVVGQATAVDINGDTNQALEGTAITEAERDEGRDEGETASLDDQERAQ